MSPDLERARLARRVTAYRRLLDIATDALAREAISHQMTRTGARIAELDAEHALALLALEASSHSTDPIN